MPEDNSKEAADFFLGAGIADPLAGITRHPLEHALAKITNEDLPHPVEHQARRGQGNNQDQGANQCAEAAAAGVSTAGCL